MAATVLPGWQHLVGQPSEVPAGDTVLLHQRPVGDAPHHREGVAGAHRQTVVGGVLTPGHSPVHIEILGEHLQDPAGLQVAAEGELRPPLQHLQVINTFLY